MEFFNEHVEKGLLARLEGAADASFAMMEYSDAVERLETAPVQFQYPVAWGANCRPSMNAT